MLALLFFVTAVLYASVGFGGGSTYNALLVLADTDYRVLPSIALACNLIVVTGGVWQYRRSGDLNLMFALPFIALSTPMAWFGGTVPIERGDVRHVPRAVAARGGPRDVVSGARIKRPRRRGRPW